MVETSSPSSRRRFLSRIWIGLGIVALLQFSAGAVAFLTSGRKRADKYTPRLLEAGAIGDFPLGSVTLIGKGHLYLTRLDDGGFLAISRKCTHLGCAVPWIAERKQFECPCHASIFDMTGNVIKAPAPRALDLFSITIEHDTVIIDINKRIKRSTFTAEQLIYPQELG
ncbi:MAG: ubiquinol-cytochrome c reductase iron-sulfur subunit [Thermodesulfobacteriota bacterium]|nr:ubiquinol-cytochrome c reductase iron-sulfur subunit [Thermodesulfobacteriota bacterium]